MLLLEVRRNFLKENIYGIFEASINSVFELGVSSNLIGLLSWSNLALLMPELVNNVRSKQNKMAGVNSRFEIKSTLNSFLRFCKCRDGMLLR